MAAPVTALTAGQWAKRWGVHRDTARARLERLRREYGSRIVQSRRGVLVATEEAIASLGGTPGGDVERSSVTEEFVERSVADAVAPIWKKIRELERRL